DRNGAIAAAAAAQLSPDALTRNHQVAHERVRDLAERGRADGSFRADMPAGWLVATCFALIHACADEVRAGRIDPGAAPGVLIETVRSVVFTGS
nr:TetR/AcrR family transcriptional regulator [Actinomycetota bacterium]